MAKMLKITALPTLLLSIAFQLTTCSNLQAGSIASVPSFGFTTSGQVGNEGVNGFNTISYQSQPDTIWGTTGNRFLGKFLVGPLPDGISTTYTNTPFSISVLPSALQVNDVWYRDDLQPVVLKGRLNGMITGTGYSNVVASFDPVSPWVDIVKGGVPGNQTFLAGTGPFLISPNGTTDASLNWALVGSASPVPVPEPTTLMIIASGFAFGLISHRRRNGRRID